LMPVPPRNGDAMTGPTGMSGAPSISVPAGALPDLAGMGKLQGWHNTK
jgi:hypothetical protein